MSDETTARPQASDEDLMRAYQLGEDQAFEILYGRYTSKVFGYLRARYIASSDVHEIFQEIFLKLHRTRSKYKVGLPFRRWLYTIMKSVLVDHIRRNRVHLETPGFNEWLDQTAAPTESLSNGRDLTAVPGFGRLPLRDQKALRLRYVDDQSFAQIGTYLSTSETNARKLISRALQKLRRSSSREEEAHEPSAVSR